jgi:phage terminase large subunit GpA-like protein
MYTLFELRENVVLGVPDLGMASDKWERDILPMIRASRYAELLPVRGAGSRQGKIFDSITFRGGQSLKFMSGSGSDAKRAGYTTRVVAATEIDKFADVGGTSDETDKLSQIEARTDSFGDAARIFLECTVTTKEGRIWREIANGSDSRVVCPCPHCHAWVTPEREHLVGWAEAETEEDSRDQSRWHCPSCAQVISEPERVAMNRASKLLHRGQTIDSDGTIIGAMPRTRTLGLRGNAFNNLFWTAAIVGAREWRAARKSDEETGKKEVLQYVWAQPYEPPVEDVSNLSADMIIGRTTMDRDGKRPAERRGYLPPDTNLLTIGIDLGKRLGHWVAPAFRDDASAHIADYGRFEIASDELGEERAVLQALREFRDQTAEVGWASDDGPLKPALVLIDAGWTGSKGSNLDEYVYAFCRESNNLAGTQRYLPAKGWAATEYTHPARPDKRVKEIGEQYHVARLLQHRALLVHVNSDYWKARVHNRLTIPIGQPGATTLYRVERQVEHLTFAKHIVAERMVSEFIPKRGNVTRFEVLSRSNHFLDAMMLAFVAGHRAGVRIVPTDAKPPAPVSGGWFAAQQRR